MVNVGSGKKKEYVKGSECQGKSVSKKKILLHISKNTEKKVSRKKSKASGTKSRYNSGERNRCVCCES